MASSSYKLVVKDAFWQIFGRILSALGGFLVVKLMTPYLGPLRYGDYSTILKFFAIWSAFADFGLYVIALNKLGGLQAEKAPQSELESYYGKFVMSRFVTIVLVYAIALIVAYMIPAYVQNPYLIRGLALGMIYSASFMAAGIVQLPLQLFRGMKHVSIALSLARIAQIIFMFGVIIVFRHANFTSSGNPYAVTAFCRVIGSIIVSSVVQ